MLDIKDFSVFEAHSGFDFKGFLLKQYQRKTLLNKNNLNLAELFF